MNTILDSIMAHKHKEVEELKSLYPANCLKRVSIFLPPPISLKKYVLRGDKSGIIAEIKRKSPANGIINPYVSIERTSIGYMQAGVSAFSILTDKEFFGGSNGDLTLATMFNFCHILRKDLNVDEYQIVEVKSIGADAILLIAAVLSPEIIMRFTKLAHTLSMEVVLEVHKEDELQANLAAGADIIGVNNRDLKSFEADIGVSEKLAALIPDNVLKISESGISSPAIVQDFRSFGYHGFLIGETFMKHSRPEVAAKEFIDALQKTSPVIS